MKRSRSPPRKMPPGPVPQQHQQAALTHQRNERQTPPQTIDGGTMVKCSELTKTCLSFAMRKILRHTAPNHGISVEPNGFAKLDDILKVNRVKSLLPKNTNAVDVIKQVVASSDKMRFTLKQSETGEWIIRANQGHGIPHIDLAELCEYEIFTPDPDFEYVHGTFFKNIPGICDGGLLSGGVDGLRGRQMIHAVKVPKG